MTDMACESSDLVNIYKVMFHTTGGVGRGPTEGWMLVNASNKTEARTKAVSRISRKYSYQQYDEREIVIDSVEDIYTT
jgi:hypothetical protein